MGNAVVFKTPLVLKRMEIEEWNHGQRLLSSVTGGLLALFRRTLAR